MRPSAGQGSVPRLQPPRPIDPGARGAAYLNAVAMQLQPGWGQFLDDCRLRLPASHALNRMTLAATAELVIDRSGKVVDVALQGSGNTDFDRAVRDAIVDAEALAAPPIELLSDDDRLHVRWLFARDRRQAGPATAEVRTVDLPLADAVAGRIASRELARAAHRIARAPAGAEREAAVHALALAALAEALAGSDGSARRAAVVAIRRAGIGELAPAVRGLLSVGNELELRLAAIAAASELRDRAAAAALGRSLATDLRTEPRLALAEASALALLGERDAVETAIRGVLDDDHAAPGARATALEALAVVPALATQLVPRLPRGEARARAATCRAAAAAELDVAAGALDRGLRDADASVRASCVDAAVVLRARQPGDRRVAALAPRLHELARDRDRAVRARAVVALVAFDPQHAVDAADDPAAEVRAAYATTIPAPPSPQQASELHALLDDRDPDVRAAAWAREAVLVLDPQHAVRATGDPAAQVRLAALPELDADVLDRLSRSDDSPEVRSEALVALAARRGRVAFEPALLERFAAAPPGSGERVRAAQAWLLAR